MALSIAFSKPRLVLDVPAYFPNVIRLRNGELFVQLMWGNDRHPIQGEYDLFYAFDGPTTAEDWMKFNDQCHAIQGNSYVHVLTGRWAYSADGGKTYAETGLPPIIEYVEKENGDVIGLQWYTYYDKNGAPIVRSWTSHDGCRNWDAPYDIPLICPPIADASYGRALFPHRRILHIKGDTYLVLMYGKLEGDERDRSMVFRTTDGFKSLHYYSTCGMWRPGIDNLAGLNETDMARTPDGRLLCVMRNQSFMPLYQTHSIDGGATWTPLSRFIDRGVDPALCVLQNGVVACSFGRPGVKVAFSENGGDDWQKVSTILWGGWEENGDTIRADAHGPMRSCSYTDVTETAPNVATVYYSAPADWADDPRKTPWDPDQRNDFRVYAVDAAVERT